jgi:hypothetical protein
MSFPISPIFALFSYPAIPFYVAWAVYTIVVSGTREALINELAPRALLWLPNRAYEPLPSGQIPNMQTTVADLAAAEGIKAPLLCLSAGEIAPTSRGGSLSLGGALIAVPPSLASQSQETLLTSEETGSLLAREVGRISLNIGPSRALLQTALIVGALFLSIDFKWTGFVVGLGINYASLALFDRLVEKRLDRRGVDIFARKLEGGVKSSSVEDMFDDESKQKAQGHFISALKKLQKLNQTHYRESVWARLCFNAAGDRRFSLQSSCDSRIAALQA